MNEKYINSINLNAKSGFPYLVLDVINDRAYPRNSGFKVMHWHEDIQFIYVIDGNIEIQTLDKREVVGKGEGAFINRRVIHCVNRMGNCHYNSFIFPPYLLRFYTSVGSELFIDGIVENSQIDFRCFRDTEEWNKVVLEYLKELIEIEKNKSEVYIYEVSVKLSSIWLEIIKNISLPMNVKKSNVNSRMEKMLKFIDENYSSNISLSDIAKSANISSSECARCFKSTLNKTPYKYLIDYRLSKAEYLLLNTDRSIGDISLEVGFTGNSYFGKYFKSFTGFTPSEYRKNDK